MRLAPHQWVVFCPTGLQAEVLQSFNDGQLGLLRAGKLRFTAAADECRLVDDPPGLDELLAIQIAPQLGHYVWRKQEN